MNEIFDYMAIKQFAREMKGRVTDFIALSNSNDPFYAGAPARQASAEWFMRNWVDLFCATGSHLRRIHYKVISQPVPILKPDGKPYRNTDKDWKFLCAASLNARYLKLLPKNSLIDRRNNEPVIYSHAKGLKTPLCHVYGSGGASLSPSFDTDINRPSIGLWETLHVDQPFLVEVWIEKSTMDDILVPLARLKGFNLISGMGELSEIHADLAVGRALEDGRPMRIIYASDMDPSGRSMPKAMARKIEYWAAHCDVPLDITVEHVLLTPAQCREYRLPETPLKKADKRAPKFRAMFGRDATELDALEALHPGEFKRIITEAVEQYIDTKLASRVNAVNYDFRLKVEAAEKEAIAPFREQFDDIEDRYSDLIDDFKDKVSELQDEANELWPQAVAALEAAAPTFDRDSIPEPRPATPPAAPLFDSKRPFMSQMEHYKSWSDVGEADDEDVGTEDAE
ncbi:MAG: hypothetical protein M9932_01830 [Xanthobacteraceae bacterium]|nr:hypothetical protein [Xanthobacteraceae bacterium]